MVDAYNFPLRVEIDRLPTVNNPDSLLVLCLDFVSVHNYLLTEQTLPREICEALLTVHTEAGRAIDSNFGQIFADTTRTKLKKVTIKRSHLTREGLQCILAHKLTHFDVSQCLRPPPTLLHQISLHGEELVELSVGSWKKIEHFPGFMNSPNLRVLEIHKWHDFGNALTLPLLLAPLKNLVSLSLSEAFGIKDLSCLASLTNLRRLYLYRFNRQNLYECNGVQTIRKMTKLTHLDISRAEGAYSNPDQVLASIVENLPDLVWLDISETNLAGRGMYNNPLKPLTYFLAIRCCT